MENIANTQELDYIKRSREAQELCIKYPFIKKMKIGSSSMGRDINAYKTGSSYDYVLFCAAFHGSEHITSNILLAFANELCFAIENDTSVAGLNARKALGGRGIIFVPCVNPDGCEISIHGKSACGVLNEKTGKLCKNDFTHWNSNIRGVDINHNFAAGWDELHRLEMQNGIYGPCATRYGGRYPESEPETAAICGLCRNYNIHHALALHTQGEVIYWNYSEKTPQNSRRMAEIMATAADYALDSPIGLAVGGGFKDWFITEFGRPAFTVEIGKGENPLPIDTANSLYLRVRELLMLCAIM